MAIFDADIIDSTAVLDPRISYEGACEDYAGDADLLAYLEATKLKLHAYYIQHYANHANASHQSVSNAMQSVTSDGSPSKVNFTSRYKKKDSVLRDELEEYFKLPHEDFDTCKPLEWWLGRRVQFPNLYCLAWDLFSIPGKSCADSSTFDTSFCTRFCCCCRAHLFWWAGHDLVAASKLATRDHSDAYGPQAASETHSYRIIGAATM